MEEAAHLETADDGGSRSSAATNAAAVIAAIVGVRSCLARVCVTTAAAIAAAVAPHREEAGECHRAARGPQSDVACPACDVHAYLSKSKSEVLACLRLSLPLPSASR
jgi:hypothetical protein